jgi:hypothetical protein
MKKETLLAVTAILLLVLNLSLLAYLYFDRSDPPPQTHKIIIEKLRYDDQQQWQFEVLRQEQHETLKRFEEQFDRVVHEYFSLLKNDAFDSAIKDSLENVMLDLQRQKARSLFEHFQKLKSLCRNEQKQSFDALLPELMHLIHPPREKNPPLPQGIEIRCRLSMKFQAPRHSCREASYHHCEPDVSGCKDGFACC